MRVQTFESLFPREPDVDYEMTPAERQEDIADWVTYVMFEKQYPPYVAYQKGRDFRPQQENK